MVYVRGKLEDYDGWASDGLTDWSWEQILSSYEAIEDHELGDDAMRGTGGPLSAFLFFLARRSCVKPSSQPGMTRGLLRRDDLNREDNEVVGYYARTVRKGRRSSAVTAFVDPVRQRTNLTIMTDFTVDRVAFEGTWAVGVTARRGADKRYLQSRAVKRSSAPLCCSGIALKS
jgi:choline dehydrogenase